MATKKKPKKIVIDTAQAEEIEGLLGEYLSGIDCNAQSTLRDLGCTKDVVKAIVGRIESIGSDLSNLREGDIERTYIDGVSEDLKHLDDYLGKTFDVTGTRGKKPYIWEVWG